MRALAMNRQSASMPQASVASDLHQAFDVLRNFATQVTFDFEVLVDKISESDDLFIRQIPYSCIGINADRHQDIFRCRKTDSENVCQSDFDSFFSRQIYAYNPRHNLPPLLTLPLLMFGIATDYPHAAFALDDFAAFTYFLYRWPDFHGQTPC